MRLRTDGHYETHGLTVGHFKFLESVEDSLLAWKSGQQMSHWARISTGDIKILNGRLTSAIMTLQMPEYVPALPMGLVGPLVGDPPVPEDVVHYHCRGGGRATRSRMIWGLPRRTSLITAIFVPDREMPNELFLVTAWGGPKAPREIDDPSMPECEREEAVRFWMEHALIREPETPPDGLPPSACDPATGIAYGDLT